MIALPLVPPQLIRQLLPTFESMMDRSIQIQLLTTKSTLKSIPEILLHIAEVRVRDEMFGGGLVADGHETLLFISQGIEREENLAIWSDHVGLNMISRGYFRHLWDTSSSVSHS